jgi:Domain of unknown function (DUF1707)
MDDRFRASDADRDRATALLRDHFAAGRLTAQELDERLAAALNAKTAGDLRRVLADLPEPALAAHEASPGSPEDGPLARGYRRLLACYPAWYRRLHEEEMLAVLMTAAPQGRRRPGAAEAADLLLGALRIRCQPSRAGGGGPVWRDALAVVSVIVPLIVAVTYAVNVTQFLVLRPGSWVLEIMIVPLVLGALVPLALRMRRVAALAAAGLLIWLISTSVGVAAGAAIPILAVGLQAVALAASGGPRRALQILTWKHAAVATIATLLACCTGRILDPAARLAVIAVTGAAMALASPLGRRLLLLLTIPAYPLLLQLFISLFPISLSLALATWPGYPALLAACYLPSLALAALAAVAARRASTRSSKPLGTPDA